MKRKLVRLGNSRAVRLPKEMLEQAGIEDDVIIEVWGDTIILRAAQTPRAGWEEAARAFAEAGGDEDEWEDWDNAPLDPE